ncbi:ABC transporter permease [Desulfitobacterium sp. Sab5]|uniref:ABC transporter permease n=1 Tax=Desulfitobacterium nosdiversum TaxID=3375356 RepID=UPI003CF81E01
MKKFQSAPYWLVMPVALLSLLFIAGIVNGLVQSFGIIPSLGLNTPTFQYYIEIFNRQDLLASMGISLFIAVVSSVLAAVLGVFLSAVLVASGMAKGKMLSLLKVPILIPHTVVALFVIALFSQNGLLARGAYALGWIHTQDAFPSLLYMNNGLGVILAYVWKEVPFIAIFVLTIMANISSTLGEAAGNLGASPWKTFIHVTLPLSMPAIKNSFLIVFAYSLGAYELPYLLGSTTPKALPVQAFIEYTHPDLRHRPYAMALNSILFFISLGLTLLYYRLFQREGKRRGDTHE